MYVYAEKKCIICGKKYKPRSGSQACCSTKCAKVRKEELRKQEITSPAQPRMSKEQRAELAKAHAKMLRRENEARAAGMSYGRYMAMLRMRQEANKKRRQDKA